MRPRNTTKILGIFAALAISGFASASLAAPTEAGSPVPDAYGKIIDNGFQLPAIPIQKLDKKFHRQVVDFQTKESAGTVIVNTRERFLYYVLSGGKAVRYGIGVGKQGFAWSGTAYVAWKQEWPTWHPPKEMASRKPEIAKYVEDGMNPGVTNPLGARAMYLFNEKGQDTLFRLHGTPEWSSIGTAASSGCIRLINQDVIDLYSRVRPGRNTKVVVIQ
ncbi:L,D-transpeptidase [Rhizobium sp. C4]|uniref:L,D-transpeptidase n=1 Tax=Rhizobium sp. C4 TaxID=1349800 RepID=UPI001E35D48E|nr:L,D-transpeptidase [Rhizobium sp. C4]MCD2174644.1 L,D-transpeptidase [Rhizobium sp. C4]